MSQKMNIEDILSFMRKNPPQRALTSDKIDELILENAKILLAYQSDTKCKAHKEVYIQQYMKHCK